jgi:hypothetical protein
MKILQHALPLAALLLAHCANIQKEHTDTNATGNGSSVGTGTGGGGGATPIAGVFLADTVVDAPGHTGSGFYDRQKAINGVRGAGSGAGSLDVFSLDNSGASTHLTLRWNGKKIKNGAGIDFIVFENAFNINGNPATRFMDLVIVEVSNDNVNFCGFAPDYTNTPETTYSNNPAYWLRFAGRTPVLYNVDSNNLTEAQLFQDNDNNYEPDLAGGDAFDLDLLSDSNYYNTGCTTLLRDELKNNGFTYLRLTPANRRINPDTGAVFVKDGMSNGPDIDGVVARYAE